MPKLTPQQKKLLLAMHFPEVAKVIDQRETNEVIKAHYKAQEELMKKIPLVKGEAGYTPVKGVDYVDGKDAEVNYPFIIDEVIKKIPIPKDGISPVIDYRKIIDSVISQIPIPENGRDAISPEIDYNKIIGEVVKKIPVPKDGKDAIIDEEVIKKQLEPHIKSFHQNIARAIDGMPRGSNYGGFIETAIKAGSNITVTKDGTGSWVIASTGGSGSGSGYQAPLTGGLTGTNTWKIAPNVIVVDGVPMQATRTDGTVNWTGTTTTVLTVAPSYDIFATA